MRRRTVLAVAGAAATAVVSGCSSSDNKTSGDNSSKTTPDKVTYLTGFGMFGRESYVYVAQEKGYFRDAGLEVTVKAGTATGENLKLISSGQADFCPVDSTGAMLQLGTGAMSGFTIIAMIHQRTLTGIMTLEGKGITTAKDLEGKTIGDASGSVITMLFPTYCKLAGVDATKAKFVVIAPPQLPAALAAGTVDAIGQFVVGKPTIEAAAGGKKAVLLPYSEYLTDLYGNALVTSTKTAKEKPDLVKRFRDALLKGLGYAIDHPDEAGKMLVKNQPTQKEAPAAAEMQLMAAYVRSAGSGAPVGAVDSQRVARAIAILQGAGAIPAGLTPEQVVSFDLAPKA